MIQPLVSCVLPTGNRRHFLAQAIKYFLRQTYSNKELIIIDDGEELADDLVQGHPQVKYLCSNVPVPLGTKLNWGIENANGKIIQKWDDDDYYHPDFLKVNLDALISRSLPGSIVCYDRLLVFLSKTGDLKITNTGWCAGSTLCFYQSLWEKQGFRPLNRAVDWHFLNDHSPTRCKISDPELHIVIRHNQHTWKKMGAQDVDEYMQRFPNYHKPLKDLISPEDFRFYSDLAGRC
jgi:glycosyltransferase involved in cell wall biosynthesis